jgi:HSP20 family protein
MNLVRWEPFRELATMREAMGRLWEDSYHWPFRLATVGNGALLPAVDIYETSSELVVKAALPGVKPEDLDVNITGNMLTIKAETKSEQETKDEEYHRKKCYGTYARTLTIPDGLKTDKAEANLENGLLTLNIPKAEESKPKTIKVKTNQITEGKRAEVKS